MAHVNRHKWKEIEAEARRLDALYVPRTRIADMLGVHRVTVQKKLGPRRGDSELVVNRDLGDEQPEDAA